MERFSLSEQAKGLLVVLASAIIAAYWLYAYIDAIRKWEDSVAWRQTAESISEIPVTKEGEGNAG